MEAREFYGQQVRAILPGQPSLGHTDLKEKAGEDLDQMIEKELDNLMFKLLTSDEAERLHLVWGGMVQRVDRIWQEIKTKE